MLSLASWFEFACDSLEVCDERRIHRYPSLSLSGFQCWEDNQSFNRGGLLSMMEEGLLGEDGESSTAGSHDDV